MKDQMAIPDARKKERSSPRIAHWCSCLWPNRRPFNPSKTKPLSSFGNLIKHLVGLFFPHLSHQNITPKPKPSILTLSPSGIVFVVIVIWGVILVQGKRKPQKIGMEYESRLGSWVEGWWRVGESKMRRYLWYSGLKAERIVKGGRLNRDGWKVESIGSGLQVGELISPHTWLLM